MVGYWDTGPSEFDITSGNLLLENGSSIKMCRGNNNTGTNVVNQSGGAVTFYSDAGVTPGGGGNLDLNYAGGSGSSSTYNLNGGTLTVPQIISSLNTGSHAFNFDGGTLKPTGNNATFMQGLTVANVRFGGAMIDDGGFDITIAQPLVHSTIVGDNPMDGGLTKLGMGELMLTGTNTYTGNTTISAGTLTLGSAGSINNSSNIAVANGALLDVSAVNSGFTLGVAQTLSGSGVVNGTVANNGTIAPGTTNAMGTLLFNNSPALNGVVVMKIEGNGGAPISDQIMQPSSAVTYGGTLTVTNIGAELEAGDSFQLFNASGYGGSFLATNLPPLNSGLAWSNSLVVNGIISVVSTVSLASTNIVWSVSGTNLTLSWPADHVGWRLQVQTDSLTGINWADVPGSSLTNNVTLFVDPTVESMFYRLVYP
jgi:autotransporter-associated beta strand protein